MFYHGVHTLAVSPSETVKEQMEIWEISRQEFAAKMGMGLDQAARYVDGDAPVTDEIAAKLSAVLGMPPSFWTGLEEDYRADLVKAKAENEAKAARVNRYAEPSPMVVPLAMGAAV